MCVVSMIMEHYNDKWKRYTGPVLPMPAPPVYPPIGPIVIQPNISQAEVDEFRELLDRARKYDREHNEPDCEMQDKVDALLAVAKALGVDISFVVKEEDPFD